jgi:uncharacterized RDD family membrane protein YckC
MQEFNAIETPENVELAQPLAGIGSRFMAGLIDHLLLGAGVSVVGFVSLVVFAGLEMLSAELAKPSWLALISLLGFAAYWGYFMGFEYLWNGQTPGKLAMRIRVTCDGGRPLGFVEAAIRNLLRPIDALLGYAVGGVSMFVTHRVQRLGDLAAATVVASEQPLDYGTSDQRRGLDFNWEPEVTPEALRASGLSPQEYRALSSYWMRCDSWSIETRARVLPPLIAPIAQRLGGPSPQAPLETLEAFVVALLRGEKPRS